MSAKLLHQTSESFFAQPPQANACKPFTEAKTRVNLFHLFFATAKKRLPATSPPEDWLRSALDRIAIDPSVNIYDLLPPSPLL